MKTHAQAMKRKEESVGMLKDRLERAQIAILTDSRGDGSGMSVKEMTELRTRLRESGSEYRIAKNTLIRRAAGELGIQGLDRYLEGPTAIAFGYDDPAATAKAVLDYAKDLKVKNLPAVKAAYFNGEVVDAAKIEAIAALPSLDQLRQQILGLILAPHRGLMTVLNGPGRAVATVLDRWSKGEGSQPSS